MEVIALLLMLVGISIFCLGIVGTFKPITKLRMATRLAASCWMILGVASCGLAGGLLPPIDKDAKQALVQNVENKDGVVNTTKPTLVSPKPSSEAVIPPKQLSDLELGQRLEINTRGNLYSKVLLSMSKTDRSHALAKIGSCTATGRTMFTGEYEGTDFWSVGCREGDIQVSFSNDGNDSKVLECSFLPRIKQKCWAGFGN